MSLIGIGLNLLLVALLCAALTVGWRLNKRLKALRDSHDNFAVSVRELNAAAARAENGLAELRAATDEAAELLGERIERGRNLATRLERLMANAPHAPSIDAVGAPRAEDPRDHRLGALLSAAREPRPRPEPVADRRDAMPARLRGLDDDLFEDPRPSLGARR